MEWAVLEEGLLEWPPPNPPPPLLVASTSAQIISVLCLTGGL